MFGKVFTKIGQIIKAVLTTQINKISKPQSLERYISINILKTSRGVQPADQNI